jgi:hypothetical protein
MVQNHNAFYRLFPVSEIAVIRPLRTATRRSWQPGGFGDSCLPDGIFHGTLDYRFVEVMPTPDAGLAVDVVTAWRKNPLPTPLAVGIRIRAPDGMGERHAARSRGKIPFVQAPSPHRAGSCGGLQFPKVKT